MRLLRTLLAVLVPPLVGTLILASAIIVGRRRALAAAIPAVSGTGLWLAGVRVQIDDVRHSARLRPAVFIFNHSSGLDPMLAGALLRRDVVAIAKSELRHNPLLGPLLGLAGTVFVRRDQSEGVEALRAALPALRAGYAIAMAPEGTRSRDGALGSFRDGARWLAAEAKVALVPVIIHGSGNCLPAGGKLIRPGTVTLQVLSPLDATETDNAELEMLYRHHLAAGPGTDAC